MKWKNGSSGSTQKGYGFIYDQINRLTTSKYGEGTSYTTNVSRYDENLTYDKNGNIQTILRKGQTSAGVFGDLDNLTFTYTSMGNQVRSIGDMVLNVAGRGDFYDGALGYSAQEYFYDMNGNTVKNDNKKMSTLYNYLNLPSRIYETNTPANKIEYVYTSAGEKLKQRLSAGTTLLYFGNYVYTLDGTANGIAVKYILTQEGRATYSSGAYTYEYLMKDHLGNTRLSFNVPSTTAVIVQQSDYYPFGMIHQPQATTTSDNRYLFNGKELQNNLLGGINLDLYDFQARFYDPQIGRWSVVDPMAENSRRWSPYTYTFDNPIRFIDPDGMQTQGADDDKKPKRNVLKESLAFMLASFVNLAEKIGDNQTGRQSSYEKQLTGYNRITERALIIQGTVEMTRASSSTSSKPENIGIVDEAGVATRGALVTEAGTPAMKGASSLAETVSGILKPGGNIIGKAGANESIRELSGGLEAAQSYWGRLVSSGSTPVLGSSYKGILMEMPNGGTIGFRTMMTKSPTTAATIDVNIPDFFQGKLKFNK